MTSPHDQPLSRRAARLAEQGEQGVAESFAQPSEGRWRAPGSGTPASAPSSVPSSAPSDMTYRTQVRPRVPHYDESHSDKHVPSSAPIIVPPRSNPPIAPPAIPAQGVERVRRRDFRPPSESDAPPTHQAPVTFDAPLEYHTQLSPRPDAPPPAATAPMPPQPHVIDSGMPRVARAVDESLEQTLSRRELRELRAAQASSSTTDTSATGPVTTGPAAAPPELHGAAVQGAAVQPVPLVVPMEFAEFGVPSAPAFSTGQVVVDEPRAVPAPAEPVPVEPAPVNSAPVEKVSTGAHWSVGIHDDDDPFENTFSREVGSATSLNTNALVLPAMPSSSIAGPVAGTGEIIVTGMIEVSHLVASTGTVPALHDSPDLDDMFDVDDHEITAPDSAPVSALKAISSHTGTHTVMTGKPSSSNTVTMVLVASTVGMAVVAIGLFVVAAMNGLF